MIDKDEIQPEFFDIDMNRLDEEWVNQPRNFFRLAARLADADKEVEIKKAQLELVQAELSKDIRLYPENYQLDKVTEKGVEAVIMSHKSYKSAFKEYIEAKYNKDIYKAAVTAMDHRKSALERLVALHGQNYFSIPQQPKDEETKERLREKDMDASFGRGRKRKAKSHVGT